MYGFHMTENTDMHLLVTDTFNKNEPQDLVTVFLWFEISINKMQLCLLSLAYACSYHNPTATMGQVGISKPTHRIHVVCGCDAVWAYCQIL